MRKAVHILLVSALCTILVPAQSVSKVWRADNGDGTYRNPILFADYSDPDAIRVGDDFYLIASSFNAVPGIPVLHSRDLVNWNLINHVFSAQRPLEVFAKPIHGGGVWAPAIRFHAGEFFIFYPDPDFGIYMTKARDPAGTWSEPVLVKAGKGLIDPCPLWDDDGKAYLVSAFAGSRAGIKSILTVTPMEPGGTRLVADPVVVFDGHDDHPTVEGPKFYKRNGYYYIFAPAGGVATGWQLVLRSKNVFGPYEEKTVLSQGRTAINGPHQGAWVATQTGEDWFIHFQDRGAYGRIVHLQPMTWKNGFPVIGVDSDGDGTGEPVLSYRKPSVGKTYPFATPPDSDEFGGNRLGLQWQWSANPGPTWAFPFPSKGALRMNSVEVQPGRRNLWNSPNLLLQKFPAERFTATARITMSPRVDGERFGLLVMGMDYAYLGLSFKNRKLFVSRATAIDAEKNPAETETMPAEFGSKVAFLRVSVEPGSICRFSYSTDGSSFTIAGEPFKAREGRWIGAKIGFFFDRPATFNDSGTVDIDWIRFEPGE